MRADRWLDFVHPEDVLAVRCSTENLITGVADAWEGEYRIRSEEHTSELQSRPVVSYAVFCLEKKSIDMTQNSD